MESQLSEQCEEEIRPLTQDEASSVAGGIFIFAALYYIYDTARNAIGGNSDMSSWQVP